MKTTRKTQILITVVAIVIAVIHVVYPGIEIDTVTLMLVILAIVPWITPLFKSLELPGGFKFEFQELKKVEQEAKAAGLIDKTIVKDQKEYSFLDIAATNPELALAGLRIEIEKSLRALAKQKRITSEKHGGIMLLMRDLHQRQIISNRERAALADIVETLNRAVHGRELDYRTTQWVIDIGPQILNSLNERIVKNNE